MKKMLYPASRFVLAAFLMAGGLTACSDDDPVPDEPKKPVDPDKEAVAIEKPAPTSKDVSQNGFAITWEAVENAAVYAYAIDADDATEDQYTLTTGASFTGLEPGTTHTVRVKAVPSKENAELKESEYAELTVTTEATTPDFFRFTQTWMHACGTGITCTPSDGETLYFFINATKAGIEYTGMEAYIQQYIEQNYFWITEWAPDGFSIFQGEASFEDRLGLNPQTEYMLIAVGVDAKGNVIKTGTFEYTTPAIGKVDCTFEIEMGNVTYNLAEYKIIPSDPHTLWTATCVLASQYEGMSDDEIVAALMNDTNLYYRNGTQEDRMGLGDQDADYVIYVIGCMQQQPTTALYKQKFHSGMQDFEFAGDAYAEVVKLNYIAEGTADWSKGFVAVSALISTNDATYTYRALCGPAEEYEELSDLELGKLIEKEFDEGQWHPEGIWLWDQSRQIPVNGRGIIATLARDAAGKSGRICRYTFTAEPFGDPGTGGGEGPGPLAKRK